MRQFDNVAIELEGNSYFDGAVTSRTVNFADGSKKTLGFSCQVSMSLVQQRQSLWKSLQEN